MTATSFRDPLRDERKILIYAAAAACFLEFAFLTAVGWHGHWLAHPQKTTGLDASKFIEAEVFKMPREEVLRSEKPVSIPARHEAVLSKKAGQGRKAKPSEKKLVEENQTKAGPPLAPTHGPIAVYAPVPAIPAYLRNENLKTSVVIEFFVTAQGNVIPRLLSSSGNEELDAIAIATVKKWQFRPAEANHKSIDSKVRLRIVFQVS